MVCKSSTIVKNRIVYDNKKFEIINKKHTIEHEKTVEKYKKEYDDNISQLRDNLQKNIEKCNQYYNTKLNKVKANLQKKTEKYYIKHGVIDEVNLSNILKSESSNEDKIVRIKEIDVDKSKKLELTYSSINLCIRNELEFLENTLYKDVDLTGIVNKVEIHKKYTQIVQYIQDNILFFVLENDSKNIVNILENYGINTGTRINELDTEQGYFYLTPQLRRKIPIIQKNYESIKIFHHPCNIIYNRDKKLILNYIDYKFSYRHVLTLNCESFTRIIDCDYGPIDKSLDDLKEMLNTYDFERYFTTLKDFETNKTNQIQPM